MVMLLGEQRKSYKTLAVWTSYAKLTAIKVLEHLGNNSEFTLIHIKNFVDIGVAPPSKYSYIVDGADKLEDKDEDEVEDERNIAAFEEVTPVIQQTLPLALAIVKVPLKTSALLQATSASPDLPAVPPDNVSQSNPVAQSNHAQFSANLVFPQEVINVITPSSVRHS
jgi:hypothetical protein